jgi:hypothetical protein
MWTPSGFLAGSSGSSNFCDCSTASPMDETESWLLSVGVAVYALAFCRRAKLAEISEANSASHP